jgi:hypothetical protein
MIPATGGAHLYFIGNKISASFSQSLQFFIRDNTFPTTTKPWTKNISNYTELPIITQWTITT